MKCGSVLGYLDQYIGHRETANHKIKEYVCLANVGQGFFPGTCGLREQVLGSCPGEICGDYEKSKRIGE